MRGIHLQLHFIFFFRFLFLIFISFSIFFFFFFIIIPFYFIFFFFDIIKLLFYFFLASVAVDSIVSSSLFPTNSSLSSTNLFSSLSFPFPPPGPHGDLMLFQVEPNNSKGPARDCLCIPSLLFLHPPTFSLSPSFSKTKKGLSLLVI